jgi:hypothetical protein
VNSAGCSLNLRGIDGANPLGFLAALGTLLAAHAAGETEARLCWKRAHTWMPVIDALSVSDPTAFSERIAGVLRGTTAIPDAENERKAAERALDKARKSIEKKRDEINARGLNRQEKRFVLEAELGPLEQERDQKRRGWLAALRLAVPRPELALGKRIDCTAKEYREHVTGFLDQDNVGHATRDSLDFLAAFGSDACRNDTRPEEIEPTPFCFIKGSGHQYFLDTVKQLIASVDPNRVRTTLFEAWAYADPGLSMRWNPVEDKRYALTDIKPADEGASTAWMANLLAYRGLALFPCAPTRQGLGTTGWSLSEEALFTWPIWESATSPDTLRSLLQLQELSAQQPDPAALRARGVAEVFRVRRIRVPPAGSNYKLNFTQSRRIG